MSETVIKGVRVSFRTRDVQLVNDTEYRFLEKLVEAEQKRAGTRATVQSVIIESDYIDTDGGWNRYVVNTHHEERDATQLPGGEDGS